MVLSAKERGFIRDVGPSEEIYKSLMKFRKDVNTLAQKRSELTEQYPNKWVAFYDDKIVATSGTLSDLLRKVDKQRLPHDKVVTQFLSTQKRTMIL